MRRLGDESGAVKSPEPPKHVFVVAESVNASHFAKVGDFRGTSVEDFADDDAHQFPLRLSNQQCKPVIMFRSGKE